MSKKPDFFTGIQNNGDDLFNILDPLPLYFNSVSGQILFKVAVYFDGDVPAGPVVI